MFPVRYEPDLYLVCGSTWYLEGLENVTVRLVCNLSVYYAIFEVPSTVTGDGCLLIRDGLPYHAVSHP